MKRSIATLMALLSLTALPAVGQEAPKQTVEGAHAFLSMLADQGNMKVEPFNAENSKYEIVFRGSIMFNAAPGRSYAGGNKSRQEGAYASVNPVAAKYFQKTKCSGELKLDATTIDTRRQTYEREIKSRSTQYEYVADYTLSSVRTSLSVDWMKVAGAKRENKGSDVTIIGTAKLTFASDDLAARAQYAMEFIRNACDPTASTGF